MSTMTPEAKALVLNKFGYHPPTNDAVVAGHEAIRGLFRTVADFLMTVLPDDPETREALDMLDKACMQANAAMARTQGNPDGRGGYPLAVFDPPLQPHAV